MENNFIQASANIETMDEEMADMPIVTKRQDNVELNTILSNNFGFGGTNACLVIQKHKAWYLNRQLYGLCLFFE